MTAKEMAELADRQLEAYNAHDVERFIACYAEDVEIYLFPHTLTSKGHQAMRERYAPYFAKNPRLNGISANRMICGKLLIDHEIITGREDIERKEALAIYEMSDGLIQRVWFG